MTTQILYDIPYLSSPKGHGKTKKKKKSRNGLKNN